MVVQISKDTKYEWHSFFLLFMTDYRQRSQHGHRHWKHLHPNFHSILCSHSTSSSVQLLTHVPLFVTPWTTACQASLSITNSWSPPKPMSIESVMPSNISSSVVPFSSCPKSFPALRSSFQMSQLFAWGGQSIGVSASTLVLPMNTQDWSPLGWTCWISLQFKGLSKWLQPR